MSDLSLCPTCWSKIKFIQGPCCQKCGTLLEYNSAQCAKCIAYDSFYFDQAKSVFMYDENTKDMVLQFKHGDKLSFGILFANLVKNFASDILKESDIIIPVPIHWSRLFKRRYNQAAVIAMYLSRASGVPFNTSTLLRTKATKPQHSSVEFRQKNVKGAFALKEEETKSILGKSILLLDDVFTTGATVNECSKTLIKGGARSVKVVTIARV